MKRDEPYQEGHEDWLGNVIEDWASGWNNCPLYQAWVTGGWHPITFEVLPPSVTWEDVA